MYVPIVIQETSEALVKRLNLFTLYGGLTSLLGYKVLVRLGEWAADKEYPLGTIEEVIGKAGMHETEMRALALGQGFSSDYPPGVNAEAEALEKTAQRFLLKKQIIRGEKTLEKSQRAR